MAVENGHYPVQVVSLTGATARRSVFSARAQGARIPWQFFPACTGVVDGLAYDAAAVERNKGRQLTAGEIGCYASHFSIWQQMVSRRVPQCIVLEDDTLVDWSLLAALSGVDLAQRRMHYLRLYAKKPALTRIVERELIPNSRRVVVEYAGYAYGTQGYALTLEGARAFLRACAVIRRPVDDEMDRSWEHGIRNLGLFPAPVIEEFVDSGIGMARFEAERSAVYHAARQRFSRWIDRQKIRAKKVRLLLGR